MNLYKNTQDSRFVTWARFYHYSLVVSHGLWYALTSFFRGACRWSSSMPSVIDAWLSALFSVNLACTVELKIFIWSDIWLCISKVERASHVGSWLLEWACLFFVEIYFVPLGFYVSGNITWNFQCGDFGGYLRCRGCVSYTGTHTPWTCWLPFQGSIISRIHLESRLRKGTHDAFGPLST